MNSLLKAVTEPSRQRTLAGCVRRGDPSMELATALSAQLLLSGLHRAQLGQDPPPIMGLLSAPELRSGESESFVLTRGE